MGDSKTIYMKGKERETFTREWTDACNRLKESRYDLSRIYISPEPTNISSTNRYGIIASNM